MDVIKKLNELRLERNMSVYRLAELSGINQSTLANTFSRGTIPSIKHLDLLCETLGVTLAQFFTEDEKLMTLSSQETQLIINYRRLPENIQSCVFGKGKTMFFISCQRVVHKSATIPCPQR